MAATLKRFDLTTSSVAVSGTVAITDPQRKKNYRIVCTGGAGMTWVLRKAVLSARKVDATTVVATNTIFVGDDGPISIMELAWSGNGGGAAVLVDIESWG